MQVLFLAQRDKPFYHCLGSAHQQNGALFLAKAKNILATATIWIWQWVMALCVRPLIPFFFWFWDSSIAHTNPKERVETDGHIFSVMSHHADDHYYFTHKRHPSPNISHLSPLLFFWWCVISATQMVSSARCIGFYHTQLSSQWYWQISLSTFMWSKSHCGYIRRRLVLFASGELFYCPLSRPFEYILLEPVKRL